MTRITSSDGTSMILGDSSQYAPQPSAGFSDTISHLINWCTHAQDLLAKIEWQHVGFEVQEDGQMNLHRPLYRCPACWSYQDTIRQTGHKDTCKISKLSSAYRTHVHIYLQELLNMATNGPTNAGPASSMDRMMVPQPSTMQSNPSQLASQNSLMAAYSKNNAGNAFLTHQNSVGGNAAAAAAAANRDTLPGGVPKFPLPSASSIMNSTSGLGLSLQQQNSVTGGGLSLQHQTSTRSTRQGSITNRHGTGSSMNTAAAGMSSSSLQGDGPALKKQKTQNGGGAGGLGDASSSLYPSSSWEGLSLEGLSSPNDMSRTISSLVGPPLDVDRGMSMLDATRPSSLLTMQNYHPPVGDASADMYMSESDLPPDSLNFTRAGSSINLESLMNDHNLESSVDSIHVSATPHGFPAFSSAPHLVGFYQYDESTTFLAFVPIAKFPAITEAQRKEMERIFKQLKEQDHGTAASSSDQGSGGSSSSSRILTRAQFITLERLKEEALLLHYASQASGFLTE